MVKLSSEKKQEWSNTGHSIEAWCKEHNLSPHKIEINRRTFFMLELRQKNYKIDTS